MVPNNNLTYRFASWMMSHIIQDVQEENAVCEYDCRKPQCTESEWMSCRRRLERAAGELMPDPTVDIPRRSGTSG